MTPAPPDKPKKPLRAPHSWGLFSPRPLSAELLKSGYTRLVRLLKITLPALALGLLSLVVLWPILTDKTGTLDIPPEEAQLSILKPQYFSQDEKSRPFSLSADKAVQSTKEPGVIQISQPRGEIALQDGQVITISAIQGYYNQKTGFLSLQGDIVVFHAEGYEIKTSQASFDGKNMAGEGNQPVTGQGPFGFFSGTGFKLMDQGNHLVLTGPARVTFTHLQ